MPISQTVSQQRKSTSEMALTLAVRPEEVMMFLLHEPYCFCARNLFAYSCEFVKGTLGL